MGRALALTRALPWIAPFALYVLAAPLESALDSGPGSVAWSFKLLPVAVALFAARAVFGPRPPGRVLWTSALLGVIGFLFWIGVESWIPYPRYGERDAFDPFAIAPPWQGAFLGLRLLALVAAAPLVEELFWRGFLLRYLVASDFEKVRFGRVGLLPIVATVALSAATHPEWLAALGYGAGLTLWLRRTESLWATIVTHGVTNGLLGLYVVATSSWRLW